jgi:hypothetical protein
MRLAQFCLSTCPIRSCMYPTHRPMKPVCCRMQHIPGHAALKCNSMKIILRPFSATGDLVSAGLFDTRNDSALNEYARAASLDVGEPLRKRRRLSFAV